MTAGPANNMDVKRRNRSNTLRCILTCDRISQLAHDPAKRKGADRTGVDPGGRLL